MYVLLLTSVQHFTCKNFTNRPIHFPDIIIKIKEDITLIKIYEMKNEIKRKIKPASD